MGQAQTQPPLPFSGDACSVPAGGKVFVVAFGVRFVS